MTSVLAASLHRRRGRTRVEGDAASLLGVEHEYSLYDSGGPVDFRLLLHRLPVAGLRLDPGDPNAYRCSFGGAMTCDGPEAEVASPPIPGRPGFAGAVDAWARCARAELERVLPSGVRAHGYSTHLNAALFTARPDRVARRYARAFAPGLMLLIERRDSPGLLVRPRPGRLELGGEYVSGARLRAAAAFAAGSTRAAVQGRAPPSLDVVLEAGVERYGWFVDRNAFGIDLYREGRATVLRRARGGTITAQEHLEASWEIARAALDDSADPADLRDADRMVAGDFPLPLERDEPAEDDIAAAALDRSTAAILVTRSRPGFTVRVEIATWDFTVFALAAPTRTGYLCIPRSWLRDFLLELDHGILDAEINQFLIAAATNRVLASVEQTTVPGLYDRVGQPSDLLPRERDPLTGRPLGAGGSARGDRPGKHETSSAKRPRGRWLAAVAAAVIVIVLVIAVAGAVLLSGGDSDERNVGVGTEREGGSGTAGGVPRAGSNFEPHGTTKGTIAYTQDGVYRVTQAITVTPAIVRPGDNVTVATFSTSVGPAWARDPDGQFRTVCDAGVASDFSRSSTSTIFLSPADGEVDALVAGLSSGGTPPGAVGASVQLAGTDFRQTSQGCDRTATADTQASMTVPLTMRPGRYALIPSWGIFAEFPGQQDQLARTGGRYPVLTVVRT